MSRVSLLFWSKVMYNTTQLQAQGYVRVSNSNNNLQRHELQLFKEAVELLQRRDIPSNLVVDICAVQYGWIADIAPAGSGCYWRRVTCSQGTWKGMRSSMSGAVEECQGRDLGKALQYLLRGY
jgi:hypothetical protein